MTAPWFDAVICCRYGLVAPWASAASAAKVETFHTLADLAGRVAELRRGRDWRLLPHPGRLVMGAEGRECLHLQVLRGEGVALDLRLLVKGESPATVQAALDLALAPESPGRGHQATPAHMAAA
jgi:hypothetical protein